MFRIEGRIEGVAPLLFNKPPLDIEKPSPGKKNLVEKIDEVETKLHRDRDGNCVIPRDMFKKVLVLGSSKAGVKVGRAGAGKFFEATIFADDLLINGGVKTFDEIHAHWGRIPPRTGAAVVLRRPMFNLGWYAHFNLNVVDDRRDADQIRRSLEEAGLLVGLAAWAPEFGRFIVTDWKVIPNA